MNKRIQILDSTLRDGGLGLEDAVKNGISFIQFDSDDIGTLTSKLSCAELDIIELGSIEITDDDRRGFAIYQDLESISKKIPKNKPKNQMFAALYRGPDTPIEDIPKWNTSLCEAVRVIIRYSELQKSLDFCSSLAAKGYKVFVQPMLTMRYTDGELERLINAANDMNAYALYFVDSYGYMQSNDVQKIFRKFDAGLNPSIRIGFHAHNNMNLAFANVLSFIGFESERRLIIDSCVLGMGQGAGNLQTELLVGYMNNCYHTIYKYDFILDACEIVEKYNKEGLWGYSVTRLLPAIHKAAYKYAIVLRKCNTLTYKEINQILSSIPDDLKHRYTQDNLIKLLQSYDLRLRLDAEVV